MPDRVFGAESQRELFFACAEESFFVSRTVKSLSLTYCIVFGVFVCLVGWLVGCFFVCVCSFGLLWLVCLACFVFCVLGCFVSFVLVCFVALFIYWLVGSLVVYVCSCGLFWFGLV